MKAIATETTERRHRDPGPIARGAPAIPYPMPQPRPVDRRDLVESEEYEFTTPLNLPGLIVAAHTATPPAPAYSPAPFNRREDDILETEDGDTVSICQLPGRIAMDGPSIADSWTEVIRREPEPRDDEYAERAAMQLPGLLIAAAEIPVAPAPPAARGLCTTCIHAETCEFPRPDGGVWRCEEYE